MQGVIFLMLAFANCVICNTNVPVLIWNSHQPGDANVPAVSALQQLSVASVQARYFDAFDPDNVLLFEQDALSVEDLSSHGAEMQHINSFMEKSHSLYLPNVIQPTQLQHDLVQQGYKVTSLSAGTAISELKLDPAEKNLVVVKLPPTITNPSRSRALRKADEVIQSVISKIGELAQFTVVYTARKPSVESGETGNGVERTRVARSLQQFGALAAPDNFHNATGILIYFRNQMQISLTGKDGPYYDIPENTVNDEAQSDTSGNKMSIILKYPNVVLGETTYSMLKITFDFLRVNSYWRSPTAEVDLTDDKRQTTSYNLTLIKWVNEYVPLGKSYACSVPLYYREVPLKTNSIDLRVNGVQVQPFMDASKQNEFGPSWDCVGFFTIGIWSGLWASLIAVIILSVGMAMLASIKTMDRFDDPKGKTIMVPLTVE